MQHHSDCPFYRAILEPGEISWAAMKSVKTAPPLKMCHFLPELTRIAISRSTTSVKAGCTNGYRHGLMMVINNFAGSITCCLRPRFEGVTISTSTATLSHWHYLAKKKRVEPHAQFRGAQLTLEVFSASCAALLIARREAFTERAGRNKLASKPHLAGKVYNKARTRRSSASVW